MERPARDRHVVGMASGGPLAQNQRNSRASPRGARAAYERSRSYQRTLEAPGWRSARERPAAMRSRSVSTTRPGGPSAGDPVTTGLVTTRKSSIAPLAEFEKVTVRRSGDSVNVSGVPYS